MKTVYLIVLRDLQGNTRNFGTLYVNPEAFDHSILEDGGVILSPCQRNRNTGLFEGAYKLGRQIYTWLAEPHWLGEE